MQTGHNATLEIGGIRLKITSWSHEACKLSTSYPRDGKKATGPFTWLQGHPYCEVCYPRMVAVLEADAKLAGMSLLETAEQWAACHAGKESYLAEAAELRRAQQYDDLGIPRDRQMEERLRRAAQANTVIGRPATAYRCENCGEVTTDLIDEIRKCRACGSEFVCKVPHGIVCKVPDGFPFEGKEAADKSLADGLEAMWKLGEDMARQHEERIIEALARNSLLGRSVPAEWRGEAQADEPIVKAKPEGT